MSSDELVPGGLLLVDKPAGCTSHDVVGRVRFLLGTRRVGHAGTLDPMATGLLILGVDRSTRLLGHLSLADKTYTATIRLGASTSTDDAEGTVTGSADAAALAGVGDAAVAAGMAALTGDISQVPSSVSALKVDGRRAYQRVRDGEEVRLAPRPVTVSRFELRAPIRRHAGGIDLDVLVACSTGTYVRALARDLGAALGVGGHLVALRRTTAGPFTLAGAVDVFGGRPPGVRGPADPDVVAAARAAVQPADEVARLVFPVRDVDPETATALRYGRPLAASGRPGTVAVYGDGRLLALVADADGMARPVLVWLPA